MSMEWKEKAINTLQEGTILFEEQSEVRQVGIVLKGKLESYGKGIRHTLGVGSFAGVTDISEGVYQISWKAVEESNIYIFPVASQEDIAKIMKVNKDYPGLMVCSLARKLLILWERCQELSEKTDQMMELLHEEYRQCTDLGAQIGFSFPAGTLLKSGEKFEKSLQLDRKVLQSFLELAQLPANVQKAYYGVCFSIAYNHILDISVLYNQIEKECQQMVLYLENLLHEAAGVKGCLLEQIGRLEMAVTATGGKPEEANKLYQKTEQTVRELVAYMKERTGLSIQMEEEHWENLRNRKNEKPEASDSTSVKGAEEIMEELDNSLDKLMKYGGMEEEKAAKFREHLRTFLALKDRFSTEDSVRVLRRNMSELFFELYLKVFLQNQELKEDNRLVDMFLNYGYLSEKLLEKNQVVQLYHRAGTISGNTGMDDDKEIPVYTAKEWLQAIYEKKKDPSKNEFDMDFFEDLREQKKSVHMTAEEEEAYLADPVKRLEFEIKNMIKSNCRLVCGQVSTFVPFLFTERIPGDMSRYCISKESVRNAMKQLHELDYSIFYREVLYVNEAKGIQKEYIQKQVYPDMILIPAAGNRGSMWQEIAGRRRDTPGRFLLPILTDVDLKDMLIPLYGRFHWELCRSIQGAAWNDIKVKSLTSEYSDYIQFYRKNKDLSEERKEKVKLQIQKARNSTKETFVMDYDIWIRFESQGAMRLNKIAREMLSTYCPFSKEIRTNLVKQSIYDEAMARFSRETARKQKEFEMRLRHIENENGEITPELQETLDYYKNS